MGRPRTIRPIIMAGTESLADDATFWRRALDGAQLGLTHDERRWLIAWSVSRGISVSTAVRRALRRAVGHMMSEERYQSRQRSSKKGG